MAILATLLKWIPAIFSALPSLIQGIEALWKGTHGSGSQKWIAIEQALSGTITAISNEVAALAAPGTSVEKISSAIAVFTKSVNDALVRLFNDLGIFQHS